MDNFGYVWEMFGICLRYVWIFSRCFVPGDPQDADVYVLRMSRFSASPKIPSKSLIAGFRGESRSGLEHSDSGPPGAKEKERRAGPRGAGGMPLSLQKKIHDLFTTFFTCLFRDDFSHTISIILFFVALLFFVTLLNRSKK